MSVPNQPTPIARLTLAKGRSKALRQGHPWLFSGAVARQEGPSDAPLAHVFSAKGECLGVGWYNPRSQIRVRLLAHGPNPPRIDRAFFAARLAEAEVLRRAVVPAETTGFRLVNAEGDGLPGWTVDRFGDVLVSQITAVGLERLREDAFAALADRHPSRAILARNHAPARRQERLDQTDHWQRGEPMAEAPFVEHGLHFIAELDGQKTGSYLDQRDNRRLAERLASGRRMLDLFAHAGAFSLYGLRGGATAVTAIESAERMAARAARHLEANPSLAAERLDWRGGQRLRGAAHRRRALRPGDLRSTLAGEAATRP